MPKIWLCFFKPRFQFRTTESLAKRYCKLSIAKKWAAHRQNLWTRFYDPSKTRDQIISNIPLGVDPIQWAQFVDYRLKPETLVKLDYFDWFIIVVVNYMINKLTFFIRSVVEKIKKIEVNKWFLIPVVLNLSREKDMRW
jgi:hypothetical protein